MCVFPRSFLFQLMKNKLVNVNGTNQYSARSAIVTSKLGILQSIGPLKSHFVPRYALQIFSSDRPNMKADEALVESYGEKSVRRHFFIVFVTSKRLHSVSVAKDPRDCDRP